MGCKVHTLLGALHILSHFSCKKLHVSVLSISISSRTLVLSDAFILAGGIIAWLFGKYFVELCTWILQRSRG